LGVGTVLWGKFWAGFGPLAVLGVGLVGVSNRLLGMPSSVALLADGTLLVMSFTLCGMGVGFGALFPRFQVENVAEIESSPGGLLYMVSALFYVAVTLALEAILVKRFYIGRNATWGWEGWWAVSSLLVLNVLAFALPFWAGKLHLENADV
jgi:ABC-2 type transport system permease protein